MGAFRFVAFLCAVSVIGCGTFPSFPAFPGTRSAPAPRADCQPVEPKEDFSFSIQGSTLVIRATRQAQCFNRRNVETERVGSPEPNPGKYFVITGRSPRERYESGPDGRRRVVQVENFWNLMERVGPTDQNGVVAFNFHGKCPEEEIGAEAFIRNDTSSLREMVSRTIRFENACKADTQEAEWAKLARKPARNSRDINEQAGYAAWVFDYICRFESSPHVAEAFRVVLQLKAFNVEKFDETVRVCGQRLAPAEKDAIRNELASRRADVQAQWALVLQEDEKRRRDAAPEIARRLDAAERANAADRAQAQADRAQAQCLQGCAAEYENCHNNVCGNSNNMPDCMKQYCEPMRVSCVSGRCGVSR